VAAACACCGRRQKKKNSRDIGDPDDRALHRKDVSENASGLIARRIDLPCLPGTSSQFEMSYLNLP
jgi:hypothetical protein